MNSKIIKTILFFSLAIFLPVFVAGNRKEEIRTPISPLNVPDDLPLEDLEAGLRTLTTDELRTLSKFIDDQGEKPTENIGTSNLLGAMENYWARHVKSTKSKKTRTIDDLYDEVAHENAEQQFKREQPRNAVPEEVMEGCTCRSVPTEIKGNNMRSKRENQYADVEKGYTAEEYVRELENSFPHSQGDKNQDDDTVVSKGHVRIKRL